MCLADPTQIDVDEVVKDTKSNISPAQGINNTRWCTSLVRGSNAGSEEADGLVIIFRRPFSTDETLLRLSEKTC
jgi:hypothetical protein